MPVGRHNGLGQSNSKRKEDVSEKVREIKQRQQNWFVQRESSKQNESVGSKNKSTLSTLSKPTPSFGGSSSKTSFSSHQPSVRNSKNDQGGKNVLDTYNNWKKAREQDLSDEDHDACSIRSDAESELERLVSPDIHISKQPIAEEDFGNLANKIASRVKQNMGMSKSSSTSNAELEHSSSLGTIDLESSWQTNRCKTFVQDAPSFSHPGNSGLASHNCPICKKLMFSSGRVPMMIIPCGHTLCKTCSEGQTTCPECDCSIVSLTVNIMLQQVIQEYHQHKHQLSTTQKSSWRDGSRNEMSVTRNISDKYKEDGKRNITSYKSQLLNLHTRQTILSEEHGVLVATLKKLTTQIQQTSSQTKSITEQEHEIKKAIVDLQDKLAALEMHRKQYESELTEIHDERSETEGKITLLSGTLASLSREIEKVKLLSEAEQNVD